MAGGQIGPGRPVVQGRFELSTGSSISDVEIDASTGTALSMFGTTATRVLAIATTENNGCLADAQSSLESSVCRSGPNRTAVDLRQGSSAEFINVNYATEQRGSGSAVSTTGTQGAAPVLRGSTDAREAATSPTIDAGRDDVTTGALDLNGNLRTLGAHTDIGAYEYVSDPPDVTGVAAAATGTTGATVGASVETHGGLVTYHVEYGPTKSYGASTQDAVLPAATSLEDVAVALIGLTPGATYHYRLVAVSDGGTTTTPDATFTTTAPPPPAGGTDEPVVPATTTTQTTTAVPPPATPLILPPTGPVVLRPTVSLSATGGRPDGQLLLNKPTISVYVSCGGAPCLASATGAVSLGGKRVGTLRAPARPTSLGADGVGIVHVASSAALRRAVRARLRRRPTTAVTIAVTATFTVGGATTEKGLTVKVRRLSKDRRTAGRRGARGDAR